MADIAVPQQRLGAGDAAGFPTVAIPRAPSAAVVWTRAFAVAWVLLGFFILDGIAGLYMDFWFFESLDLQNVFWVNFRMGATLFTIALVSLTLAAALPATVHRLSGSARKRFVQIGAMVGIVGGILAGSEYLRFLPYFRSQAFGEKDPVFGHDIGFYAFKLPAIETAIGWAALWALFGLLCSIVAAYLAEPRPEKPRAMRKFIYIIGRVSTPFTRLAYVLLVAILAVRAWVMRYGVLTFDNTNSAVFNGAEFLDVTGFFSRVNGYTIEALAIFFASALALRLGSFHRAVMNNDRRLAQSLKMSMLLIAILPGLGVDLAFKGVLALRDQAKVTPNEPVVQLPFIKRHIDATRKAYELDKVQEIPFRPAEADDPKPSLERILNSPTMKNASLWPGYVSWLEEILDLQHQDRVVLAEGDTKIYGPTLDVFQQIEKLRPYYDFVSVDTARYTVNGEKRMYTTAVRELPVFTDEEPPWLAWWGQRFQLFTHGHGLTMGKVAEQGPGGSMVIASGGIPTKAESPELLPEREGIYYGEGSVSPAYTNLKGVKEFDYPTEQGRATVTYPKNVDGGVPIDSFLKRLVFGWKSRLTMDIVFSDLVTRESRIHYYRPPLERVERIAPFLYFDTNPFAVAADGGISWMVNGMTHTNRYPYSRMMDLGDKSDVRSPTDRPTRESNYARDAIKGTVDAYTGKVKLYKWADEPVANTWDAIYPGLFANKSEMTSDIRQQVQYPVQYFHTQFDDVYVFYHMKDPVTFFNQEDLWDDGDEVKGPIIDEGEAISFSIEPYFWIAETGNALPDSSERDQFSLSMIFTPESALNLRSIPTVYMDGEDYGKLSVLLVPKGQFVPGPEQADAAIDQDALISSQITLWKRLGTEVIRGHTTAAIIENEVIYLEPLLIRSKQNPVPQMKRVVAVFRGQPYMGVTLEDALASALEGKPEARLEGPSGPEQ